MARAYKKPKKASRQRKSLFGGKGKRFFFSAKERNLEDEVPHVEVNMHLPLGSLISGWKAFKEKASLDASF